MSTGPCHDENMKFNGVAKEISANVKKGAAISKETWEKFDEKAARFHACEADQEAKSPTKTPSREVKASGRTDWVVE